MKTVVHYNHFNTSYDSAVVPIDSFKRLNIVPTIDSEDIVDEEGNVTGTNETKTISLVFEDDSLSTSVELKLDEKEFESFIKLLQVMARGHFKISL